MKTALCLLALATAAAAQDKAINVNFNACAGGGGSSGGGAGAGAPVPNKEQPSGQCNVKRLVRYVEADFPPYDDIDPETHELKGMMVELFTHMCENTEALKGVECFQVRDAWDMIWTARHYPGVGLTDGYYDFATAFVNTLRAQSFAYSHHIFERVANHFVALASRSEVAFGERGEGERVGLICSWGDAPLVRKQYDKATFVCADDSDGQFALLDAGEVDLIWVGATEWTEIDKKFNVDGEDAKYVTVGPEQQLALGDNHENAIAWMFAKDNTCALELVNRGLEEVMGSQFFTDLCARHPITCKELQK